MFEKNIENMSSVELVEYITKTFHIPLRKNIQKLDLLVVSLVSHQINNYPELIHLTELFSQFRAGILKHINREDFVVFPAIIRFEKLYADKLTNFSDDFEFMDKLVNDVTMNNQHSEFNLYLSSIIELLEGSDINNKHVEDFEIIKNIFISIQDDNIIHSEIENTDLYFKGKQLQNKLKEKLKNIIANY